MTPPQKLALLLLWKPIAAWATASADSGPDVSLVIVAPRALKSEFDLDLDGDEDDKVVFDCSTEWEDGTNRWALSWSQRKKAWCCKHFEVACDEPRSEPYLCGEGVPNWKQGWSRTKQDWCCRHHNVGCREEVDGDHVEDDKETMLAAVGLPADFCGVSSTLDDDTGEFRPPPTGLQPVCNAQMTTNCSVSYSGMRCPSECSYIAPNPHFVCVFQCVPADQCASANVNRPFADPVARLCTGCQVRGCLVCSSGSTCRKCHDSFDLSEDGSSCTFRLASSSPLKIVGHGLKVVAGVLILAGIVYTCIRGSHPNQEENMVAITRARRSRHLSKVLDWNPTSHRHVAKHFPLGVPVHQETSLGVGLPLFYNSICFVLFASLATAFATWTVFSQSQVSHVLGAEHRSEWELAESSLVSPFGRSPALIASPLASCGERSASDAMVGLHNFAEKNFYAIGLLYLVLFVASLIHGFSQLRSARRYSQDHSMMSDFALHLSGMHKDLVDEEDLLKKIQQAVDAVFRNDSPPQVQGVSICYDFSDVKEEVEAMKDRFVQRMDLDVKKKAGQFHQSEKQAEYALREQVEKDRLKAQRWFSPGSQERLRSTGEFFVIFKLRQDKVRAWKEREALSRELQGLAAETSSSPNASSLRLNLTTSEPPSFLWEHAAASEKGIRAKGLLRLTFSTIFLFAVLQGICIVPYTLGVVLPFYKSGSSSAGTAVRVLGVIVGAGNQLLGLRLLTSADSLGFHRKDTLDVVIFLANLCIALLNTVVSLAVQAIVVSQVTGGRGANSVFHIGTVQSIGAEAELASSFYDTLMPGVFFLGHLIIFVVAGMLPFICNTLLMKSIYVWRCYPDCMLRRLQAWLPGASKLTLQSYPAHAAEKALQVMKVGLSWEYGVLITTPTICFSMLFFLSPFVWRTFVALAVSTVFYYCFCRCMHFRVCCPGFFTTKRLDVVAHCFWGLPLSIVAAAAAYWGLRSRSLFPELLDEQEEEGEGEGQGPPHLQRGVVALSFFISLLSYLACYYLCVLRPRRAEEEEEAAVSVRDIDSVAEACFYTWYNCNPVFTLKCEYYFQSKTRIQDSVAKSPGVVRVFVDGARGLRDADWLPFCGGSDPYCVVEVVGKPQSRISTASSAAATATGGTSTSKPKSGSFRSFFTSASKKGTTTTSGSAPIWKYSGELRNYAAGDSLKITVFDRDPLKKDDVLGVATLTADQISNGYNGDLALTLPNGKQQGGQVKLSVEAPEVSQTQTRIHIKSAGGLRDADWVAGKSDCFCVCEVVGKPELQIVTDVCSGTDDPVWNFSTGLELDASDDLVFTVMDKDLLKQSDCLGTVTLQAQNMTRRSRGPLALTQTNGTSAFLEVEIEPPESGLRHPSCNVGAHPMACGFDPNQIRFYQVGKEYLFLGEEKQRLLKSGVQDSLEPETILEGLFYLMGSKPQHLFAALYSNFCCCLSTKTSPSPSSLSLPGLPKDSSRRFLAVRTGESSP